MKVIHILCLAACVALAAGNPYRAIAQSYHDAVLEDAKGPVKTIKYENRTLEYGPDGALLTFEGEKPFTSVERNAQGYITSTTDQTRLQGAAEGLIAKEFHRYTYDKQGRVATDVWIYEDPMFDSEIWTLDKHYYDQKGLRVKTEVYDMDETSTAPETIWYYEYVRVDERGNWTERNYRMVDPGLQEWDSDMLEAFGYTQEDVEKRGTETRTITYYDAPGEVAPVREVQPEVTHPAEEYSRYIDVPEELTVEIMLERPLGVVNTREVDRSTLLAIAKSRPDLFIDPAKVQAHYLFGTDVGCHSKLRYDGYLVKYVSVRFDKKGRLESNYFAIQVPVEQIPTFAERLANALRAMGIPVKPKKWEGNKGFQGYHGPHTVSIMYDKKKSDQRISPSVNLSITYDEHLL